MSNSDDCEEESEQQSAPDQELANLIWLQRTREDRLAAFRRHP